MKKHEIRVTIDSTEKQQKVIEILNRYNEPICKYGLDINKMWKTLYYNGYNWSIALIKENLTEITLDQLDELLKNESK